MREKTPEFFTLITDNVTEIRQSEGPFIMGPAKSIQRMGRIEFRNFAGQYSEYNVAGFLIHEATHISEQNRGLPYTKEAEIRAREEEIAFFRALERAEGCSFEEIIQFIENEISMIRRGHLYRELP